MLIGAVFAAAREVFSPALRSILWKALALTAALLALVWLGLTRLFDYLLTNHPVSTSSWR
jgi:CysZ protein